MHEVDVGDASKTMVKGKQNDTNLGRMYEKWWNIYDAQSQDRRNRLYSGYVEGCGYGRSWNPELSEHFVQRLESDGLDQTIR